MSKYHRSASQARGLVVFETLIKRYGVVQMEARVRTRVIFFTSLVCSLSLSLPPPLLATPRWAAADAEIKVPSIEVTELEGSPSKA